jgi:hypothetical protein
MFRRLNALESMPSAERYRFSTLQGRYALLIDRWERLQGEKEAGRRPGLYGHFREAPPEAAAAFSGGPNAVRWPAAREARVVPMESEREPSSDATAKRARVRGERLRLEDLEGPERERQVRDRLGEGETLGLPSAMGAYASSPKENHGEPHEATGLARLPGAGSAAGASPAQTVAASPAQNERSRRRSCRCPMEASGSGNYWTTRSPSSRSGRQLRRRLVSNDWHPRRAVLRTRRPSSTSSRPLTIQPHRAHNPVSARDRRQRLRGDQRVPEVDRACRGSRSRTLTGRLYEKAERNDEGGRVRPTMRIDRSMRDPRRNPLVWTRADLPSLLVNYPRDAPPPDGEGVGVRRGGPVPHRPVDRPVSSQEAAEETEGEAEPRQISVSDSAGSGAATAPAAAGPRRPGTRPASQDPGSAPGLARPRAPQTQRRPTPAGGTSLVPVPPGSSVLIPPPVEITPPSEPEIRRSDGADARGAAGEEEPRRTSSQFRSQFQFELTTDY